MNYIFPLALALSAIISSRFITVFYNNELYDHLNYIAVFLSRQEVARRSQRDHIRTTHEKASTYSGQLDSCNRAATDVTELQQITWAAHVKTFS